MISNGFFLRPELIEKLNAAGLQEMQISIDGVRRNETTEKVLDNLKKRLLALRDHARFRVTVSGVIGAAPPNEAEEVIAFARELGFTPRVLLVHDENGQLKLKPEEVKAFQRIVEHVAEKLDGFFKLPQTAGARWHGAIQMPRREPLSLHRRIWQRELVFPNPLCLVEAPDELHARRFARAVSHATNRATKPAPSAARVPRVSSTTGAHKRGGGSLRKQSLREAALPLR